MACIKSERVPIVSLLVFLVEQLEVVMDDVLMHVAEKVVISKQVFKDFLMHGDRCNLHHIGFRGCKRVG